VRPFRFGVTLYPVSTGTPGWVDAVRQAEEDGFDVVTVMDHFHSGGIWSALVSAHHAAPSLRVGTVVVNTDFWHPALLAREAITADELTGGRLELGLGAGWDLEDYRTLGWERRPAGERIERLAETLEILGQAFAGTPIEFSGKHFTVKAAGPWPRPRQERIPILVGGGGRGILGLAGRKASIVSISRNFQHGAPASWREPDGTDPGADPTSARVGWVADAAGERFGALELHTMVVKLVRGRRAEASAQLAAAYGLSPAQVLASPHFLVGSVEEMASDLLERRARWGISYWGLSGGNAPGGNDLAVMGEVIGAVRAADNANTI
jgi:probable F420-dependent oxidoreductase